MGSLHLRFVLPFPGGVVPPRVGRSLGDRAWPGVIRTLGDALRTVVGLRFLVRSQGLRLLRADVLRSPFGGFVAVLFVFHLIQFLPIPFVPLYLVGQLRLSDQEISLGNALMQAAADAFAGPMAELLVALETGGKPSLSGEDNLHTMALIEAAYESAHTHTAVSPKKWLKEE